MPYLTVAELRGHLEGTPLSDAALLDIIEDVTAEIDDRYGPVGVNVVERFPAFGDRRTDVVLNRKPASIVSIVEDLDSTAIATRTLDPADFRLSGYRLTRLTSGPNPGYGWSWYGGTVTYLPRDDSVRRKMAIVDVAKEEIAHSGFASRSLGDYSEARGSNGSAGELERARSAILRRRLAPKGGIVIR